MGFNDKNENNVENCSTLNNRFQIIFYLMIILHSSSIHLNGNELTSDESQNEHNKMLADDVILFCKTNGRKNLAFISVGAKDGYNITKNEQKTLTDFIPQAIKSNYNNSYSRYFSSLSDAKQQVKITPTTDTLIFILPLPALSDKLLLSGTFSYISQVKIQSSIVVISEFNENIQNVEEEIIEPTLNDLKLSLFFYLVNIDKKPVWKEIITLQNEPKVVINNLTLGNNLIIKEHYNLQGLNIQNLVLSWSPYSTIDGCNVEGRECKTEVGIVPDFVHSLSERFNFTWTSKKETTGKWGVLPQDGTPFDLEEGKWGGVMGGVINGDFHTSLAGWTWNLQRENVLDLVMFQKEWTVLAVSPKPPKVDIQLFIRPFRYDAWHFIIGMTFLLITFLLIPYVWLHRSLLWEDTQGFMISKTTAWIFFFLLNAFYGGAMTMFFASEVSLPFETVREAMQSYPGTFIIHIEKHAVIVLL